jgi:hypothetical protein
MIGMVTTITAQAQAVIPPGRLLERRVCSAVAFSAKQKITAALPTGATTPRMSGTISTGFVLPSNLKKSVAPGMQFSLFRY